MSKQKDGFATKIGFIFAAAGSAVGLGNLWKFPYGAYADKQQNMVTSSILVPVLDTAVALLASLAIIPAVFSAGLEPSQGPGLLFVVLPSIFASFGPVLGRILTIIFFLLAQFAAFTTSVAMIELPVNWLMDRFGLSRTKSVLIDGIVTLVFCVLSALSYGGGAVANIHILGRNYPILADGSSLFNSFARCLHRHPTEKVIDPIYYKSDQRLSTGVRIWLVIRKADSWLPKRGMTVNADED